MRTAWIVAISLSLSSICAAQVTGRLYLNKDTYAPGEPVFLYYDVTNNGSRPVNVPQADPYSFCSGYHVTLSTDASDDSSCAPPGIAGSCLSSDVQIPPHSTRTERLLLNYEHDLQKPGAYEVRAQRSLSYADASVDFFSTSKDILNVENDLHFRIDEHASPDRAGIEKLIRDLQAPRPETRREAARALASVAPRSEEAVLLEFANNAEFRDFAPLAFHNLNTPRSLAATAELLVKSEAGSYAHMESARYLSETDDPRWYPLLREVANKHAQISSYVSYAARLGGEDAVPFLVKLAHTADDTFSPINAISALGDTGASGAVPVLIELLRSPDDDLSRRALGSLQRLTHKQVGTERYVEHPQNQYAKWAQWWSGAGKTAHLFRPGECGEMETIP